MPLFGSNKPLKIRQLVEQRDVKMLIKVLLYQRGIEERFLHKKEEEVRQGAARALGQIGDARAVEPLITVLNHRHSHVREAAVEALGQIGDARAINPLLAALNDSSESVRRSASEALKRMEPKLDDQQRVQAAIAQAAWAEVVGFGSIAVQPLIKFLNEPKPPDLPKVIKALGQIGDARAVEPLISILNHSDLHVREAAIEALGKIGDARAFNPLIAALNDGHGFVHYRASEALKQMEPKLDDQQRVQAAIAQAGSVPARWKEVVGFGSIAVQPLIAALNDGAINVRQMVIEGLGQIGDVQAVQPLIAALNDSHSDVRSSAAQALGKIGDAGAFNPLIAALNDSDSSVRSSAAQALKPMEQQLDEQQRIQVAIASEAWEEVVGFGSAAVQPLITELDKGYTSAAAKALAEIGDARAVEPLIAQLGNTHRLGIWPGDPLVGERVATSLQTIKLDPDWLTSELGSQAIGKLITALTEAGIAWQKADRDHFDEWQHQVTPTTDAWRIVKGIAAVIPNFGTQAIESVAALLNDNNWVVRMVAAVTLARVGDTRAIEPLMAILEDSDKKARERLVEALEPLQEQLNDQQRAQLAIARKA